MLAHIKSQSHLTCLTAKKKKKIIIMNTKNMFIIYKKKMRKIDTNNFRVYDYIN